MDCVLLSIFLLLLPSSYNWGPFFWAKIKVEKCFTLFLSEKIGINQVKARKFSSFYWFQQFNRILLMPFTIKLAKAFLSLNMWFDILVKRTLFWFLFFSSPLLHLFCILFSFTRDYFRSKVIFFFFLTKE